MLTAIVGALVVLFKFLLCIVLLAIMVLGWAIIAEGTWRILFETRKGPPGRRR